jgi:hypothetical protein
MLLVALAATATIAGPGAWEAAAAAGGVHFDPDSPAGQEYALPLERAREEAAGTQGQSGSGEKGAALFGAGVSGGGPSGSAAAGPGGSQGASAGEGASGVRAGAGNGTAQEGTARAQPRGGPASTSIALAESGGGFSFLAGAAMVAAILLAAAIVGLVVRRLPSGATS